MRRSFAWLIAGLAALSTAAQAQPRAPLPPVPVVRGVDAPGPQADRSPVILVSIDGFRADYLKRGLTPTLQTLADGGVRAVAMHPAFPSLTFPNHYTLVTGLTPDHHGVVANTMEDASIQPDDRFTLGTYAAVSDARWWAGAEPIWVTAQAAGLRAATLFWPGSEAAIGGGRPDRWAHFDATITPDQRVDIVLDWLDAPAGKKPHFVTLYFDAVDHAGHADGPDSPQVDAALRQTDAAIARLMTGLRARGLAGTAELVIVADHGMAATSSDRVLYLDDAAGAAGLHIVTSGAVAEVKGAGPGGDAALARLLAWRTPHGRCWRRGEMPAHLRYGANPRIPPVVCVAQAGWLYATRAEVADHPGGVLKGEHGYDPADPRMDALFIAHGPAFRAGYVQPAFDNLDVYPLLAHLLRLAPRPNDGRLAEVAGMLAR